MWEKFKKERLESYLEAKAEGKVDDDIVDLLDLINSFDCFVTLSSCSGRIAVINLRKPGDKANAEFLGKWHKGVDAESIIKAAIKSRNTAWLVQYPPIIHVACRDLEVARILMNIANQAGFRRSGIISLKNNVVEVASLERLELPIAEGGRMLIDSEYLEYVVRCANEKLLKGKEKLRRLHSALESFQR
uniref:tRNA(Phe) 7-((3-amino-3-carboxypropyl)-4-demethylwyosine(37)-N(4))-methyltransferase n=1 Tax=Archaeoglobus fulgidus TaxID=2234 RepID=A0A7C3MAE2_ARCFL